MLHERTFVAGHRGLVGSAIVRALARARLPAPLVRTRAELDLADGPAVRAFFRRERPNVVYLAAARVGGILVNSVARWDFLYENLAIQNSVLAAALDARTERVVFFGSSCIYPRLAPQPIREEYLLSGPLEATNEPYAVAKIAGVKLVEAANAQYGCRWVSLMPTNLYGPGDNFDLETSHVLPAMIRKFHEAKVAGEQGRRRPVELWGTGSGYREFLYVDDLADAAVHVAASGVTGLLNVGFGSDIMIRDLAERVADIVGSESDIYWDTTRPDGTPRKLLDSGRLFATGWRPRVSLDEGIQWTYEAFLRAGPDPRGAGASARVPLDRSRDS